MSLFRFPRNLSHLLIIEMLLFLTLIYRNLLRLILLKLNSITKFRIFVRKPMILINIMQKIAIYLNLALMYIYGCGTDSKNSHLLVGDIIFLIFAKSQPYTQSHKRFE